MRCCTYYLRESQQSIIHYIHRQMQGTSNNPIDIGSDHEDQVQNKLQQARNKIIIEKAIFNKDPIGLVMAAIKTTIRGDLKRKNQLLNRTIIKYFQKQVGINISNQHFHPRPDAQYGQDNPIDPESLLLYGVDLLTTQWINKCFNLDNNLSGVTWINSSCCRVIFKNKQAAQKVLQAFVSNPESLKGKVVDESNQGRPEGWFKLYEDYERYGFSRSLYLRYWTEKDQQLEKETQSKFKVYLQAQGSLFPYLFEHFNAHASYENIIRKIQRQRNSRPHNRNNMNRDRNNENRSRTRQRNGRQSSRTPYSRNSNGRTPYSQRRDGGDTPYNRQDRYDRIHEPQQFRMRQVRTVHYEHEPVSMRRRNDDYNRSSYRQPYNKPATNGNRYYDCNDIDHEDNLSFSMRSEYPRHESDDENFEDANMTILFKPDANSRKDNNASRLDLSFNMNQSILEKSMMKGGNKDLSLVMDPNVSVIKEKEDYSFAMKESRQDKGDQPEQDLSILMGLNEDMSPIHPANQELDFEMKKDDRKGPIKSNLPTPVMNKESKPKVNITIPIDDSESSGY